MKVFISILFSNCFIAISILYFGGEFISVVIGYWVYTFLEVINSIIKEALTQRRKLKDDFRLRNLFKSDEGFFAIFQTSFLLSLGIFVFFISLFFIQQGKIYFDLRMFLITLLGMFPRIIIKNFNQSYTNIFSMKIPILKNIIILSVGFVGAFSISNMNLNLMTILFLLVESIVEVLSKSKHFKWSDNR